MFHIKISILESNLLIQIKVNIRIISFGMYSGQVHLYKHRSVYTDVHLIPFTLSKRWNHYKCLKTENEQCKLWLKMKVLVTQSSLTLSNSMNCSPLGPLSLEFSRQEYWSGQPLPSPGDLNPGIKSRSPMLQADSLPSEPPGKPIPVYGVTKSWA